MLEECLASETNSVITAAAVALKKLRKKDEALKLANPDRVRDLMKRDPDRFDKRLRALVEWSDSTA